jgi:hypothetical protein
MGEAFIVRKGGVVSETTAAPTITIISETNEDVTFTLTNNDDNTAIVTYEIDDEYGAVELAAAATSSNITIALDPDTYTLTAYATVVGEVASSESVSVTVQIFEFELLYDSTGTVTLPQTQIDITGLSIGKNDELRLVYTFVGDTTTTANYALFVNDNNTATNYDKEFLDGNGSTLEAGARNNADFAFAQSTRKAAGFLDIKVSENSKYVAQTYIAARIGADAANITQAAQNIVGTGFTLTSITKLSIVSSRTNGIASGSRIRLYKVNTGEA